MGPTRKSRAIFISYRRSDSEGHSGRLFRDLSDHFGKEKVLIDVVGMEKGRDFRRTIESRLAISNVMIAVIGRTWADVTDEDGKRRLDNPNDLVRVETVSALKMDIPVIPVLVGGARLPREDSLPEEMRDLVYRDGVEVSHTRWDSDIQHLISVLSPLINVKSDFSGGAFRTIRKYRNWMGTTVIVGGSVIALNSNWEPKVDRSQLFESLAEVQQLPAIEKNKVVADKVVADKVAADKVAADKVAADKVAADKVAADKVAADKVAGRAKYAKLDELVRSMASIDGFQLEVIIAVGYSDGSKSDAYSQKLSERYAGNVKEYLILKGIPSNRIYTEGKGNKKPVTDNIGDVRVTSNALVEIEAIGTSLSADGGRKKVVLSADVIM